MERAEKAKQWLSKSVYPLWRKQGVDSTNGSFVECLSENGEPQHVPQRAMVQARQIYAFNEASKLQILEREFVEKTIRRAIDFFVERYSAPSGGFVHSIDEAGQPANRQLDLYTQAFALFGLANAYEVLADENLKKRALQLIQYLRAERKVAKGGFSEIIVGQTPFQSNPHMHLFEAAIAWMRIDRDPTWKELASSILDLCQSKFAGNEAGVVAEQFDAEWSPCLEGGRFYWEPGHQCEWAWLILEFENAGGAPARELANRIFSASEKCGVSAGRLIDEVWSDGKAKKSSSRFWPQSERIKAAVALGEGPVADEAFDALFKFFEGMKPGLWEDQILEDGKFKKQAVKASSLYHIINALSEYINKR